MPKQYITNGNRDLRDALTGEYLREAMERSSKTKSGVNRFVLYDGIFSRSLRRRKK